MNENSWGILVTTGLYLRGIMYALFSKEFSRNTFFRIRLAGDLHFKRFRIHYIYYKFFVCNVYRFFYCLYVHDMKFFVFQDMMEIK